LSGLDLVAVRPAPAAVVYELHVIKHHIEVGLQEAVKEAQIGKEIRLMDYDGLAHSASSSAATLAAPSKVTPSSPA
jgi:hypothetical protein